MTKEQAIELVNKHLALHQRKNYRLHVIDESSRQEDQWWYISVGPEDCAGIRRYDYYDVLAEVEREIEDEEEGVNISLMPPPSGV